MPRFFKVEKPIVKLLSLIGSFGGQGVMFQVPLKRYREFFAEKFSQLRVSAKDDKVVLLARLEPFLWSVVASTSSMSKNTIPEGIGRLPGIWIFACWGRNIEVPTEDPPNRP